MTRGFLGIWKIGSDCCAMDRAKLHRVVGLFRSRGQKSSVSRASALYAEPSHSSPSRVAPKYTNLISPAPTQRPWHRRPPTDGLETPVSIRTRSVASWSVGTEERIFSGQWVVVVGMRWFRAGPAAGRWRIWEMQNAGSRGKACNRGENTGNEGWLGALLG